VMANRNVAEIWRHDFIPAPGMTGYAAYKGFHRDGKPFEVEDWPLARSLMKGEVVRDEEISFQRGDSTYGIMSVSSSPIRARDGQIVAAVVSFEDITERKRAELSQREVAALEERQRIARELHDSVSQSLYGIGLAARTALELLTRDPEKARSILQYTLTLAQSGLTEMRSLILELRPELLATEGLIRALTKQMEAVQQRRDVEVDASLCSEPDIPLPAKEAFYRIAQEAVNNAVKHARAHHIAVRLVCHDHQAELEIVDDGVGFDPNGEFPGHMGLRSMRERADAVGAHFAINSAPGEGAKVTVAYPLHG
jgi:signal transduction histidine kinase